MECSLTFKGAFPPREQAKKYYKHSKGEGKKAKKKCASPTGNRTPVSCVTGRDTYHYTIEDWLVTAATKLRVLTLHQAGGREKKERSEQQGKSEGQGYPKYRASSNQGLHQVGPKKKKVTSLEPDLNQRPMDVCYVANYSPPLYQLSYRG